MFGRLAAWENGNIVAILRLRSSCFLTRFVFFDVFAREFRWGHRRSDFILLNRNEIILLLVFDNLTAYDCLLTNYRWRQRLTPVSKVLHVVKAVILSIDLLELLLKKVRM